jgi:hypothetical protein
MSRKKRGFARDRETRNYSARGVHSTTNSLILLLKVLLDGFQSNWRDLSLLFLFSPPIIVPLLFSIFFL